MYCVNPTEIKHVQIFDVLTSHTVISCPDIADPVNGQIIFAPDRWAPFDYGTTDEYSCNNGFTLSEAENMRVCGGDGLSDVGEWSREDYTCQAQGEKALVSVGHLTGTLILVLCNPESMCLSNVQSVGYSYECLWLSILIPKLSILMVLLILYVI